MIRLTGYLFIFLAMFTIAGGHWAVLQTMAWTSMIIEYSQNATFAEALTKTFSGKAPCKMCKAIDKGKEKESRQPASIKADKKIDKFFATAQHTTPLPPVHAYFYPPIRKNAANALPSEPPAPVPILA